MTCDSFLGCIAEPARHAILEALADGPLHVGPLARRVGLEQSNVSHHLRLLRGCGFVRFTRDGKANLYALAHPQVAVLLKTIRATKDLLERTEPTPMAGTDAGPATTLAPPVRSGGRRRREAAQASAGPVDA